MTLDVSEVDWQREVRQHVLDVQADVLQAVQGMISGDNLAVDMVTRPSAWPTSSAPLTYFLFTAESDPADAGSAVQVCHACNSPVNMLCAMAHAHQSCTVLCFTRCSASHLHLYCIEGVMLLRALKSYRQSTHMAS